MNTTTHPDHNHTARAAGVVGLTAIALVHVLDLQGKLAETPYLGYAYVALIVASLVAAAMLIRGNVRNGWLLGGAAALAALAGYVINRTIGMPSATEDIGNWLEPLGLASIFIEACVAALAASELVATRAENPAEDPTSERHLARRPARV